MKKLESLSAFQSNSLNKMQMTKIKGGIAEDPIGDTATGSGTVCVHPARSASGCMSYSKDSIDENGNASYTPTNGTPANSDVDNPC